MSISSISYTRHQSRVIFGADIEVVDFCTRQRGTDPDKVSVNLREFLRKCQAEYQYRRLLNRECEAANMIASMFQARRSST